MADKQTALSIVLRAIDKATAPVRSAVARIKASISGLAGRIGERLAKLATPAGLLSGFKAIGGAVQGLLGKIPLLGGVLTGLVVGAVAGLVSLAGQFAELGDKAEQAGVGIDWLAGMRFAAKKSGADIQALDASMATFSKSLGLARANAGPLAGLLGKVYPPLLKQLKAAKGNEEAFDLLADAMSKLKDPAKRAALAQAALGNAALAPLLARGAAGIKGLRDEHGRLAGSQEEAVAASGELGDAMDNLDAAVQGAKAGLVRGLAPALKVVVERMTNWLVDHRDDIKVWAQEIGEKIPGAVEKVVEFVSSLPGKFKAAWDTIGPIVEKIVNAVETVSDAVGALTQSVGIEDINAQIAIQREKVLNGGKLLTPQELVSRSMQRVRDATAGVREVATSTPILSGPDGSPQLSSVAAIVAATSKKVQTSDAFNTARGQPNLFDQAQANLASLRPPSAEEIAVALAKHSSEARIKIDMTNVPRGTDVKIDPRSDADIQLGVGYQMGY